MKSSKKYMVFTIILLMIFVLSLSVSFALDDDDNIGGDEYSSMDDINANNNINHEIMNEDDSNNQNQLSIEDSYLKDISKNKKTESNKVTVYENKNFTSWIKTYNNTIIRNCNLTNVTNFGNLTISNSNFRNVNSDLIIVYNKGNLSLVNVTIENCTSPRSIVYGANITKIVNCSFINNKLKKTLNITYLMNLTNTKIENSIFKDNHAKISLTKADIVNSTFKTTNAKSKVTSWIKLYGKSSIKNSNLTNITNFGTLTISNSNFRNVNSGLIVVYNKGNLSLVNVTIQNCSSLKYILYGGNITKIINCTFKNNYLNESASTTILAFLKGTYIENFVYHNNRGGMILINSTVLNSSFASNYKNNTDYAYHGGGAIRTYGVCNISNSTFSNNFIITNMTKISVAGAIYNAGNLTITNTILNNNTANRAGAILNYNANLTLSNSQITNNNAKENGGAIYCYGGKAIIIGNKFDKNNATKGGDIYSNNKYDLTIDNNNFTNTKIKEDGGSLFLENGRANITKNKIMNIQTVSSYDTRTGTYGYSNIIKSISSSVILRNNTLTSTKKSYIDLNGSIVLERNNIRNVEITLYNLTSTIKNNTFNNSTIKNHKHVTMAYDISDDLVMGNSKLNFESNVFLESEIINYLGKITLTKNNFTESYINTYGGESIIKNNFFKDIEMEFLGKTTIDNNNFTSCQLSPVVNDEGDLIKLYGVYISNHYLWNNQGYNSNMTFNKNNVYSTSLNIENSGNTANMKITNSTFKKVKKYVYDLIVNWGNASVIDNNFTDITTESNIIENIYGNILIKNNSFKNINTKLYEFYVDNVRLGSVIWNGYNITAKANITSNIFENISAVIIYNDDAIMNVKNNTFKKITVKTTYEDNRVFLTTPNLISNRLNYNANSVISGNIFINNTAINASIISNTITSEAAKNNGTNSYLSIENNVFINNTSSENGTIDNLGNIIIKNNTFNRSFDKKYNSTVYNSALEYIDTYSWYGREVTTIYKLKGNATIVNNAFSSNLNIAIKNDGGILIQSNNTVKN